MDVHELYYRRLEYNSRDSEWFLLKIKPYHLVSYHLVSYRLVS